MSPYGPIRARLACMVSDACKVLGTLGGQFMVVKLFKRFFCFKLLPLWARFCLKIIDFDENHKITNKNIKGVKSLKKYKRGFAIRTWKIIDLLSKTDDLIKNEKFS